jgi:hypothetical protein
MRRSDDSERSNKYRPNRRLATLALGESECRVTADGVITTVVGNGLISVDFRALGDGGPATEARLNEVTGVDVDPGGNLFLAQSQGRFRRVDALTG